jgi:DNA polymerase-1
MLRKVRSLVQPSCWVVVWDGGLAAERLAIFPEYKAQRAEMPADLRSQLDQIVAYLRAARIPSWMREGSEADDCIAVLSSQAVEAGMRVVIATGDKDFMQLVGSSVQLLGPGDKPDTFWGVEEVRRKTGVEPEQIVDWLSLVGDTVDNIPGVPGVGPKTASNLLGQFGSIEALYRRLSEVSSQRLRKSLAQSAQLVKRNQSLVRLDQSVICSLKVADLGVQTPDREELRSLYARWGFEGLSRELHEEEMDLFGR